MIRQAVLASMLLAGSAAAQDSTLNAVDLTTVVSPREVCYRDGKAHSVGSVIFVDLPRGCTREGTRALKMAETRICEMVEGTPMWLPLYDIPLSSVTEEIGVDCER